METTNLPHSVQGRILRLFNTGLYTDVTFIVGEGDNIKNFNAHRLILSSASDVFGAMFYGFIPEKSTCIRLPDLDPKGFDVMLRYVYEGKANFNSVDDAIETLHVAHKYLLEHLQKLCGSYMCNCIKADTACKIYEAACLYDMHSLQLKSLQELITNTDEVIKCKNFAYVHQNTIEMVLRQDQLQLSSESSLFNALVDWGTVQAKLNGLEAVSANIRPVIEPYLSDIRFLSMTAKEFVDGPANSIMLDEEVLPLVMNIISSGSRSLPSWICKKTEREKPCNKELICSVKCHSNSLLQASQKETRYLECKLSVKKKNVFILGIGTGAKEHFESSFGEKFTVSNVIKGILTFWNFSKGCRSLCTSVTVEQDYYGNCQVMFPTPQLVFEGETCRILIDLCKSEKLTQCEAKYPKEITSMAGTDFLFESTEIQLKNSSHIHIVHFWCFD